MVDSVDIPVTQWRTPPESPSLPDGGVHIWLLQLDRPQPVIDRMFSLLAEDEQARAERFVRPIHGRRFTVAHAELRTVLAKYTTLQPEEIEFETNEYGKPHINQTTDIAFNLSHSGDLALVAVTTHPAIGVDIEHYRDKLEADKIARRHFSDREVDVLFSLPEAQREEAFYACWTRKEAYIKARGEGLALGLKRFDVAFAPGARPELLRSEDGEAELSRWTFIALQTAERNAAACVVEGPLGEVSYWDAGLHEGDA